MKHTANRNADNIEACICDLLEIVLGYPRVPVFLQDGLRIWVVLAECPFVHDGAIRVVRLENGWRYPPVL